MAGSRDEYCLKELQLLRTFFEFCADRDYERNVVHRDLEPPKYQGCRGGNVQLRVSAWANALVDSTRTTAASRGAPRVGIFLG
jgi:hypothetical protein